MNATTRLFRGQVDLYRFKCIVCGNNLIDRYSMGYLIDPMRNAKFRFIRYEGELYVALCTQACEDLYRITPDEYRICQDSD